MSNRDLKIYILNYALQVWILCRHPLLDEPFPYTSDVSVTNPDLYFPCLLILGASDLSPVILIDIRGYPFSGPCINNMKNRTRFRNRRSHTYLHFYWYQLYHLIDRVEDICNFAMISPKGHDTFPFVMKTKVQWSKNVRDEQECPDQILLGL